MVNVATKPEIEFPDGPAPAELVIEDIVVGDGAEAVPGGTVEVHYVGVEYDTGDEFDSSWNRNESIEFPCAGSSKAGRMAFPECASAAAASSSSRRQRRTAQPDPGIGSRVRR